MVRTKEERQRELKGSLKIQKKELLKTKKKYIEDRNKTDEKIKEIIKVIEEKEEIKELKKEIKEITSRSKEAQLKKEILKKKYKELEENLEESKKLLELKNEKEKINDLIEEIEEELEKKNGELEKLEINTKNENQSEEKKESLIEKIQNEIKESKERVIDLKCEIIKSEGNVIENIIHMADVHIRLSERHDIYMKVFKKLFNDLEEYKKKNKNTIILICGDLLHVKDKLDADTIIMTWNFLKRLSEIFAVIIIPGNHDCIKESDRTDTITAILQDRPLGNIHYLLNSGVYIYENIIFGLSSIKDGYIMCEEKLDELLDHMEININHDIKNIKRISLYHGEIKSIKKTIQYTNTNSKISLSQFGNYDYYLLGDIHLHQYLNEKKTAAYPGSLISQTVAEVGNHGYIVWNILTGDSQYIKLENEHEFLDIQLEEIVDIENEKIIISDVKLKEKIDYRTYGILRVFIDDNLLDKISPTYIQEYIKSKYEKTTTTTINKKVKDLKENNINRNEIKQRSEKLVRKYIENTYFDGDLTEEMIELIIKELERLQSETSTENLYNLKTNWKILWVSFNNMCLYGTNNIMEFFDEYKNEVVLILGQNAIGKSSIIDIITYILFGYSARSSEMIYPKNILNKDSENASGMIMIESEGKKYIIERFCGRFKKEIKHDVNLYELINVKENNESEYSKYKKIKINEDEYFMIINKIDINRTKKDIMKIIGTYDNFINSSVVLQNNIKTFQLKNNKERMKFLFDALQINYSDNMKSIIRTKKTNLTSIRNGIISNLSDELKIDGKKQTETFILNIRTNNLIREKEKYDEKILQITNLNNEYLNIDNEIKEHYLELEEKQLNIVKTTELLEYENLDLNSKNNYILNKNIILEKLLKKKVELDTIITSLNLDLINLKSQIIKDYENINNKNILLEINKLNCQKKNVYKNYDQIKIKKQMKKLKSQLNKYQDLSDIEKYINENKTLIDNKYKEKINVNFDHDTLQFELNNNTIKINNLKSNNLYKDQTTIIEEYDNLMKNNLDTLDNIITKLKNKTSKKINDHNEINMLVHKLEETINVVLKKDIMNNTIDKFNSLNELLENISLIEIHNKQIEKHIEIIHKNNIIDEEIELLKEENSLLEDYGDLVNFNYNLDIEQQIEKLNIEYENNIKITEKYTRLQSQIIKYNEYNNELSEINKKIDEVKLSISNYKKIEQDYLNNCNIKEEITVIKNIINNLNNKKTSLHLDIIKNEKIKNDTYNKIIFIEDKLKSYDNMQQEYVIYDVLMKIIDDKGVQLYVLENSLQFLNNKINDILKNNFDFRNEIFLFIEDFEKKKIIQLGVGSMDNLIESFSGMEAVVLDLAIKIAMSEINELPKLNMLFIDESISVFDSEKLKNIDKVFNYILNYYSNIFLITHIDSIKDRMNYVINITHNNQKSFINNSNSIINIEDKHNPHNNITSSKIKPEINMINDVELNDDSFNYDDFKHYDSDNEIKNTKRRKHKFSNKNNHV